MRPITHACVAALVALQAAAAEPPSMLEVKAMPIDELKRLYLACDRLASETVLDFGSAALCSTISEQVLQRGFDGDFERLLAWWRRNKLR